MKAILMIALLFAAGGAHAEVYKCTAGGKTTYSDVPCPAAQKIHINPKTNSYPAEPITSNREQLDREDKLSKCAELSEQVKRAKPDTSTSVGDRMAAAQNYKTLRGQYESQCLSSEERNAASQERLERKLDKLQSLQRQTDIRQQQIQNRQRGYGY
jgi:hypothetical protein